MVWIHEGTRHYHLHAACLARELQSPAPLVEQSASWTAEDEARRRGLRRCARCYGSAGKTA